MRFDAVVIGCGRSGFAAAKSLLARGLSVCVVSEGLRLGADPSEPYAAEAELSRSGATVLRGDRVLSGEWAGRRLLAVHTANLEEDAIAAERFVLATGKFFSRGLAGDMERIYEPVFGADVEYTPGRENWYDPDFFARQPFMDFGVKTDASGRVLFGGELAENLWAVGRIIARGFAGADISKI